MNSCSGVTVVGLTGQSGSGKSTVSEVFGNNGFSVINADKVARQVTMPGTECMKIIESVFPECMNESTGEMNRQRMARLVFSNPDMMLLYSKIIYPFITTQILREIRTLSTEGASYILLDAPTLFESKADDFCNYIVSVIAEERIRFERIVKRDGISPENVKKRFSAQKGNNYYIKRSDAVIYNNGSFEELVSEAEKTVLKIKEMFDEKRR